MNDLIFIEHRYEIFTSKMIGSERKKIFFNKCDIQGIYNIENSVNHLTVCLSLANENCTQHIVATEMFP